VNQPQAPPELRAALAAITRHVDDYANHARLPRAAWGAPKLPDSPSIRMDVWKGKVIASIEEELLSRIPG
jgi:hypothetical protein